MALLTIQTLTPLWTGSAQTKPPHMDRLHETGLLGCLRWWYEALVRGVDGEACDPSNQPCQFDRKKYDQAGQIKDHRQRLRRAGLCDVCQVFGATGWKRRFTLMVEPETDQNKEKTVKLDGTKFEGGSGQRNKNWVLSPGADGQIQAHLQGEKTALIYDLMCLISRHAALGAKTQLGYGVCQIQSDENFIGTSLLAELKAIQPLNQNNPNRYQDFPDIRRMFFSTLLIDGQVNDVMECWRQLKIDLRLCITDRNLRHCTMGWVQSATKRGSRVSLSRPYQINNAWHARLWGWAPAQDIDSVSSLIYKWGERKNVKQWIQYKSALDQTHKNVSITNFIQELMEGSHAV